MILKASSGFLDFYNENSFRTNNNSKNISENNIYHLYILNKLIGIIY